MAVGLLLCVGWQASGQGPSGTAGDSATSPGGTQAGLHARRSGPGSLSPQEEERLDRIVNRFIEYDLGRSADRQARQELEALGPEAIPALVRGLNRSALQRHSCPASVLHRKLRSLIRQVDDERTLRFIYDNVGAGVGRSPYQGLIQDLKLAVVLRRRELDEAKRSAAASAGSGQNDPFAPAGLGRKSPGEQVPPREDPQP
jgi:hypothetical protein